MLALGPILLGTFLVFIDISVEMYMIFSVRDPQIIEYRNETGPSEG